LKPIENAWRSLELYLQNIYKPQNLNQLQDGIKQFWATLIPEVCSRYISHLKKVIPKVVEKEGGPSGY